MLFAGRNDGRLTALNIDTGHQLWDFQTGAGMNAPVTTFEHEGEQYVAAYSADNLFAGSRHGDSLWLFSLNGILGEATETDAIELTQAEDTPADVEVVFAEGEPDLASGGLLYRQTCLPCHGEDGMGGHNAGAPLNNLASIRDAIQVVSAGRKDMPAFSGAPSPEQIRDVSGFVLEGLFK